MAMPRSGLRTERGSHTVEIDFMLSLFGRCVSPGEAMYLGVLYVTLELEPEVTSTDRERLLRALRDRVRQAFGQRITVRTDGESAVMVAFFDESYGRARSRCDEVLENIEASGEARVEYSNAQVFAWFDAAFQECVDDSGGDDDDSSENSRENTETIRYASPDDDEQQSRPRMIPSRFARRTARSPVRK